LESPIRGGGLPMSFIKEQITVEGWQIAER